MIVEVEVFKFNSAGNKQLLFRRELEQNSNLYVPYDTLFASLRCLFGRGVFISFTSPSE